MYRSLCRCVKSTRVDFVPCSAMSQRHFWESLEITSKIPGPLSAIGLSTVLDSTNSFPVALQFISSDTVDDVVVPLLPAPSTVVKEAEALCLAHKVIHEGVGRRSTRQLIHALLQSRHEDTLEERVISSAMAYIAKEKSCVISEPHKKGSFDDILCQTTAYVWYLWSQNRSEEALQVIQRFRTTVSNSLRVAGIKSGAIHRRVLNYWLQACEALILGQIPKSKKLWKRSLELGAHFGTDSHPMICWTYVASFY